MIVVFLSSFTLYSVVNESANLLCRICLDLLRSIFTIIICSLAATAVLILGVAISVLLSYSRSTSVLFPPKKPPHTFGATTGIRFSKARTCNTNARDRYLFWLFLTERRVTLRLCAQQILIFLETLNHSR